MGRIRVLWDQLGVVSVAALLLVAGLSSTDLWAPDEPRYAQVAEELRALERGPADLILLRLGGEPYSQKPPLYFWLAALAGAPGERVTELAARLPSAVAGVATVWLTLQLGIRLFGAPQALWGAGLLLTCFGFAHLARRVQLDVLLTFFETLAMLAFWRLDRRRGSRPRALALLHAALGLAVLTKGPVGLLPLAAIGAFLAWEGRAAALRELLAPRWLLLSLGPGLLWLASAVAVAPPGFFAEAVVGNVLGRFFAGTSHARPWYYYAYQLPLDFLPWTLLWPAVWIAARREARPSRGPTGRPWRLLLAWIAVFLTFFSLSSGKRGLYLLPIFPPLALLCGAALDALLSRRDRVPTALFAGLAALGAATIGFGVWLWDSGGVELGFAPGFGLSPSFGATLAAIAASAGIAWAWVARSGSSAGRIAVVVATVYALEFALFRSLYPTFDAEKSPRPIARAASRWTPPGRSVGVFANRALVGGIAYYGDRTVAPLPSVDVARAFVVSGGGAIVAKRRDLERLRRQISVEVQGRWRSGRRELVVVTATSRESPSIREPPR